MAVSSDDDFASSVLVSMVDSHLGVGTMIILLRLVPFLILSVFVICEVSEVITVCFVLWLVAFQSQISVCYYVRPLFLYL
jgi:hypothetical protein